MKTKIVIADDHAMLRAGLKLLLQSKADYEVVGEAADGQQAIALFEQLRPDILILDISLPLVDGIQVLKILKASFPEARVIVLTMHEEEDYIKSVMQAGAAGYIPKTAVDDELFSALEIVSKGRVYLSQQEAKMLIGRPDKRLNRPGPLVNLSSREQEVFRLLIHGYSMADIARLLSLSPKTVNTHKERILTKLNMTKKSELVEYAIKSGLIQPINC